jgi:hypothetical protein
MRLYKIGIVLLLGSMACRGGGEGSPDASGSTADAKTPDGGSVASTIKQLVTTPPAFKSDIAIKGVVITAKKASSTRVAEFWVQDAGGGLGSGIHIYCNTGAQSNACPSQIADIDALKIGDVVDISGKFDNNNFSGHPDDYEIIAPVITKQNKTMAPMAVTVDAAKVAVDQFASADFKGGLQNTLVKVQGPITISNLMAAEYGTTNCGGDAASATAYIYGFEAMVGSTTIAVGMKYPTFSSCMPDCDVCGGNSQCKSCTQDHHVQPAQTFSSITGIAYGDKQVGTSFIEIRPTSDTDLAP